MIEIWLYRKKSGKTTAHMPSDGGLLSRVLELRGKGGILAYGYPLCELRMQASTSTCKADDYETNWYLERYISLSGTLPMIYVARHNLPFRNLLAIFG